MGEYTYQEMLKMQEEAANRVREMKKRAAIAVEDDFSEPTRQMKKIPDEVNLISYPVELSETESAAAHNTVEKAEEPRQNQNSLLRMITDDPDAVLIMALLAVLSQDMTDYPTFLALLYLLL